MLKNRNSLSMLVAASGTIIEWFDFSLFFYLATSLTHTFYPTGSPLIVLATGAVGFVFRPLGAVVFGHLGDTRGRAHVLIISAALMAVSMAGIALMPGHATIGIWGGVGVLALRALAGFSVGAEYTGIMVYLMESAPPQRRGFAASWAAANSEVGALLAVGLAALTTALVGTDALHAWAWRIPFALGAFLAAAMIPLRRFMVETPAMSQLRAETAHRLATSTDRRSPLSYALGDQRRPIWAAFLISTVGSATYFLTITYLPTYLETVEGTDSQFALNLGVVAAIAAILVTPLIGLATDRFGARTVFRVTLLAVILLALPGYAIVRSPLAWVSLLAAAGLAIPAAAWSAVAASAIPDQFTARSRFSGMAVGYNVATVLFGGLTPALVAWLIQLTGNPLMPAYYGMTIALLAGLPAIALLRRQ